MAMVGVANGSLQPDSRPKLTGLVRGLAANWRRTLANARPGIRQHCKYRLLIKMLSNYFYFFSCAINVKRLYPSRTNENAGLQMFS